MLDAGQPRNKASRALHGFLTRDGMSPPALRRAARREVLHYPSVTIRGAAVRRIRRLPEGFELTTTRGASVRALFVLFATGRQDNLPSVPGLARFYGRGVHHCPYCDGWEHRGETMVVYDRDGAGLGLVEELQTWASALVLCTDGKKPVPRARRLGVRVVSSRFVRAEGDRRGRLAALRLASGERLQCGALFFCSDCVQRSVLPKAIGCRFDRTGSIVCRGHAATGVPGLFVAGNVRGGVHLAITAAAEGAEAALAINAKLAARARRLRRRRSSRGPV